MHEFEYTELRAWDFVCVLSEGRKIWVHHESLKGRWLRIRRSFCALAEPEPWRGHHPAYGTSEHTVMVQVKSSATDEFNPLPSLQVKDMRELRYSVYSGEFADLYPPELLDDTDVALAFLASEDVKLNH